jgi:hypothetical protein
MHSSSAPCVVHACPSNPPWLDHSNYIWRRVQDIKVLIMKYSPASYYFIFCQNILLSSLYSNILSLCHSFNVRDQVSHTRKTTISIIVTYILIFKFSFSLEEAMDLSQDRLLLDLTADEKTRSSKVNSSFIHQWLYSPFFWGGGPVPFYRGAGIA